VRRFGKLQAGGGRTDASTRVVSDQYHLAMAMTLRLTDAEHEALQQCAAAEGISMQDAARRAVREYVIRSAHRARVHAAADLLLVAHADVLEPAEP
jgi:predicted transcriptional regulator